MLSKPRGERQKQPAEGRAKHQTLCIWGTQAGAATQTSPMLQEEPGTISKNHGRPRNHHPLKPWKAMESPSPPASSNSIITNHSMHRGEGKTPNPVDFVSLWAQILHPNQCHALG